MVPPNKPIRLALIGLSASATGTGWATQAHLPYLLKSPEKYTITALLNSSVGNARKAISAYNLPSSTKAYGNPDDLANDPDIDMVVANTRVDKHAAVLLPSLKAGKVGFCEWPLDKNARVAEEMVEAAREGGAKTITGLQARFSPVVQRVREIIAAGRIGKVLSSTVVASAGNAGAEDGVKIEYFTDRSVGGNILSIHFGHCELGLV
jgi:predicted dehydrogenase